MKITITYPQVGGAATAFVLCDDTVSLVTSTTWPSGAGGQCKEGFLSSHKRKVDRVDLIRSPYLLLIPRYNRCNSIAFTVQRAFTSVETCMNFIADHPDTIPDIGEITLTNQDSSGIMTRYLPNAVLESADCVLHVGQSCNHHYVLTGNGPWQKTT